MKKFYKNEIIDEKFKSVTKRKKNNTKLSIFPSKFIGPGIFKYSKDFIHVDLVRGLKVERRENETDRELEKRAVKECYAELKKMQVAYKEKARELGFKVK